MNGPAKTLFLAGALIVLLLSALPATAATPFVGTFDVFFTVNQGTGSTPELGPDFWDCWKIHKSGAIRSIAGLSLLQHGRILDQSDADGSTADTADFVVTYDGNNPIAIQGKVRGTIALKATGKTTSGGGAFRGRLQGLYPQGSYSGWVLLTPAKSGAFCGLDNFPREEGGEPILVPRN